MRLSLKQGNNRTLKRCRKIRVLFNDRDVTHRVFAVDSREGWIRGYVRLGDDGPVMVKQGRPVTVQLHGRVRIERRAA
jgi:hypothetical protein